VGANRIVPAVAIPHPLGNPALPEDEERELRLNLVKKALRALQTEVEKQTVFEEYSENGLRPKGRGQGFTDRS
jgi:betaine reductase